jgi:hypothetical protein
MTPRDLNQLIAKVYSESDGKANVLLTPVDSPLGKAIENGEFEKTLENVHSWMDEPLIDPNTN